MGLKHAAELHVVAAKFDEKIGEVEKLQEELKEVHNAKNTVGSEDDIVHRQQLWTTPMMILCVLGRPRMVPLLQLL